MVMWEKGAIGIKDSKGKMVSIQFLLKHYDEPKEFGINKGKISELLLKKNGEIVYCFNNGKERKPKTPEAEKALAILVAEYN